MGGSMANVMIFLHHAERGRGNDSHLVDNDGDEQERHVDECVLKGDGGAQLHDALGQRAVEPDVTAGEGKVESASVKEP